MLFAFAPLLAQSEVKANSALVFENVKLSEVLIQLSELKNLNFSYDANDPVYNKTISFRSSGENTDEILSEIILKNGLEYKQIGNQIVLFQSKNSRVETGIIVEQAVLQGTDSNSEIVGERFDAGPILEYKLDTIYLMDTIVRVDTIRLTDTVFIEKAKTENTTPAKIKKIPVDFFQPGIERDKGWAMNLFAAPLLSDFSMVDGQKAFTLRSFSLGIDAVKLLERWNVSAGLRLTQFNQRFTQQYTQEEGGFYNTDTIDAYYTVIDMDTAWYYVTDSSWIPLQTQEYSYEQTNTLGYLELNLSASFDVFQSKKMRVYLKAGGQISFLIYNSGIAIPDKNNGEGVNFNELQFNTVNYSILMGAGFKYRIADKADFFSELYYSGYFNSIVPDFPINTNINAIGLKFGLVFYF
ncbi:MAG TPA: FecR domain-containing protein [Bacteroidales bacterium]